MLNYGYKTYVHVVYDFNNTKQYRKYIDIFKECMQQLF